MMNIFKALVVLAVLISFPANSMAFWKSKKKRDRSGNSEITFVKNIRDEDADYVSNSISLKYGYYYSNDIVLGLGVDYCSSESKTYDTKSSTTTLTPLVKKIFFDVTESGKIAPYVGAAYVNIQSEGDGVSADPYTGYQLFAGVDYYITKRIAIALEYERFSINHPDEGEPDITYGKWLIPVRIHFF